MLKDVLNQIDIAVLTTSGLILFFVVFVGVTFYAFTRAPRQTEAWSRIPLTGDTQDIQTPSEER